jgi:transcriptional regulator with XRE-family HTH domain
MNLRALRLKKGMNQEELAEKLDTTSATVSRWENEECEPNITKLVLITQILECSLNDLLLNPTPPRQRRPGSSKEKGEKVPA